VSTIASPIKTPNFTKIMLSAIVDPVYDIEVSDDNQGYGIIEEEDPIEMMTRKLEREKRREKAKKPISLMMEREVVRNQMGRIASKMFKEKYKYYSWCKVYSYCFLLFLPENCMVDADILYSFIPDPDASVP
jgi:hypothetical protein